MKPCDELPRRWNSRGEWTQRWHALFCAECRRARSVDHKLADGIRALRREQAPSEVERHVLERLELPQEETTLPLIGEGAHSRRMLTVRVVAATAVLVSASVGIAQWLPGRATPRAVSVVPVRPNVPERVERSASRPLPVRELIPPSVSPLAGVRTSVRLAGHGELPGRLHADSSPHSGNLAKPVSGANLHSPRIRSDDLAFLNGQPARDTGRWVPPASDPAQQVEERVRDSIRMPDDFITIPFPRLAADSVRQIAAAAESYKREAAIVDPRLAREVTVAAKGMALVDLCERLRADSGVQLTAGGSVADEKVTLFCQKQPLREVMRQLSRPFGYTWLRSAPPGQPKAGEERAYRYELAQDLKSQLLEEELRNRDRNAALVALDREMGHFRPYLGLTPEQARARLQSAPAVDKPLLEKLAGAGWGAIQMYFRLSPRDLANLRAGQMLKFATPPRSDDQPLPAEVAAGIPEKPQPQEERSGPEGAAEGGAGGAGRREEDLELRRLGGAAPPVPPTEPRTEVQLSIEPSELGRFTLVGASGRMTTTPDGTHMWMSRDSLAVGQSPAARPQNGATNAKLSRDPALQRRVAVAPGSRGQGAGSRGDDRRPAGEKVSSADVLEALHRATGMPIAADFYTRMHSRGSATLKDRPLYETLNQLADLLRQRWNRDGNWLQFRSSSFYHDRLKEVPNRLMSRWAASRQKHGYLPLDDLIEIAQLSDAQLDAAEMAEGARVLWGLTEWDLARGRSPRPHLRLMATFTPAQRQTVTGRDGLPFTQMSLAQQQQFLLLAFGGRSDPSQSLEDLAGAALRVDYAPPGSFEWRPAQTPTGDVIVRGGPRRRGDGPPFGLTDAPAVRERTREAALAAARRIDPNVTPAQIVPSQGALSVVYTTTGPEGRVPLLALRATGNSVSVTANRGRPRRDDGGPPSPP